MLCFIYMLYHWQAHDENVMIKKINHAHIHSQNLIVEQYLTVEQRVWVFAK